MSNLGAAAMVAFWMFLAIVSVAGIIYDYRKKRLAVETLRQAIQSGQQIDGGHRFGLSLTQACLQNGGHAAEPELTHCAL